MSNDQPMMMSRVQNESMGAQKAQSLKSFFVSLFDACSREAVIVGKYFVCAANTMLLL